MKFKEHGDKSLPTIILLHGGGLSWWSLLKIVQELESDYHVITPIIDGHGEDCEQTFVSIEESAKNVIKYIDMNFKGTVFAIGGMSIGAQIVVEILSVRPDITKYAIIESALVFPIRITGLLAVPFVRLFHFLVKKRWYSKLQAKAIRVPENMFEEYHRDASRLTKDTLMNIILSNTNYHLKSEICLTQAKALVIVGEKEPNLMKRSAFRLHEVIPESELYIVPKLWHGQFSLDYPLEYVRTVRSFLKSKSRQ